MDPFDPRNVRGYKIHATYDSDTLSMVVFTNTDGEVYVWWSDGPRQSTDIEPSLHEAMVQFAKTILSREGLGD